MKWNILFIQGYFKKKVGEESSDLGGLLSKGDFSVVLKMWGETTKLWVFNAVCLHKKDLTGMSTLH